MNNTLSVITIDGPAGVGKTTISRRLAETLHIAYLDTGAMFRCLALKLGEHAHTLPEHSIIEHCHEFEFSIAGTGFTTQLLCNNIPIENEIRTEKVGMLASRLGTVPIIRKILGEIQRKMGENNSLVAEGRDMGTVIFPDAKFKFFLEATPEVRALRRMRDQNNIDTNTDLATLTVQIRQRDALDRNRTIAPLRAATDAMVIDTSDLNEEEVLGHIINTINVRGGI